MKILSVTLENFGSFLGKHTIELADRGMMFVAGVNEDEPRMQSNGAGKSTLFNSIEWCLYGEIPKMDVADSVVNDAVGTGTTVTVRLLDDKHPVSVQRFRKVRSKSGLRLWVGAHVSDLEDAEEDRHRSHEHTSLDVKETQAELEAILGLDVEVFRAAIYRSQVETFNFADASDGERKEMLTRILQLGELDRWLVRAKEAESANDGERSKVNALRATDEGELRGLEGTDLGHAIEEWDRQREARLETLRTRYLEKNVRMEELVLGVGRAPLFEARLQELRTMMPVENQGARLETEGRLREIAALRERSRTMETEIQRLNREARAMELSGIGRCLRCGQNVTADHLRLEISRKTTEARAFTSEVNPVTARIQEMEADLHRCEVELKRDRDAFQKLLKDHIAEASAIESELRRIEADRREAERIAIDLGKIELEGQAVKGEINPFLVAKTETEGRITKLRARVANHGATLSELALRQKLLEFWVQGFGPRGLKSYVLDAQLAELNEAANRWVKLLTGGTMWVRFETQTLAKSQKTLSEKMNIRVFGYRPNGQIVERNYRSWSGGEKARIALGIDFGLSGLVAARAKKPYDLLILDEVFRHLDGKGREAVLELLQHLAREKASIFVIDHDQLWKNEFENTLVVRKKDGRSEVLAA